MDTRENAQIVREFFAALTRGDVDAALASMSDDATLWINGSTGMSGLHDKHWFDNNLRGNNPDWRRPSFNGPLELNITGVTSDGDRVAVELESRGELADGSTYENHYHHLFVLADGKIVAIKEYMDTMLAQATFCDESLRREADALRSSETEHR
jgi:hypothetical protein